MNIRMAKILNLEVHGSLLQLEKGMLNPNGNGNTMLWERNVCYIMDSLANKYYYNLPLFKLSNTPIQLKDDSDNSMASIQRIYRNNVNRVLSWVIDSWELSVEAADLQGKVTVRIMDNHKWFGRNTWTITVINDSKESKYLLQDQSKIKTHPRFSITLEGQEMLISKNLGDKKTRIVNSTNNKLVGEIKNVSIGKYVKREIVLYEDTLSPILISCLDYLIKTMY